MERSAQIFEGDKKQADELAILEQNHRLAQQHIGRLTIENEFLEKIGVLDSGERKLLIDSMFQKLEVTVQCDLLGLPRSTFYYRPVAASAQDLDA